MTSVAAVKNRDSRDAFVSAESEQLARPIRDLLSVGWEMGASTSMTEAAEVEPPVGSHELRQEFGRLANAWRQQTRYLSSTHEIVLHPAYQRIIGMGPSALRFIFQELEASPDHWFWALSAITGEDPVPSEEKGNLRAMTHHWLQWARRRGHTGAW